MTRRQRRTVNQQAKTRYRNSHGGITNRVRHQPLAFRQHIIEGRQLLMLLKMLQQHGRRGQNQIDVLRIGSIKQLFQ